ncbi:RING finger protein 145 isoform X2 [Syngnathoides biaculeatus]|uniref:RING finger protein 145 isoform X2 n=1 Tax=Syngnathoides biaculeatus TaxID=300417 RepID=UPI002ADD86E3|nr:RING finger protein 145 isoform X2 [Syngnathoides biaculeatus]
MARLEELANVALRVPCILVLDMLYKYDIVALTEHLRAKNEHMFCKYRWVICDMFYIGQLLISVLLVLPLRHIVSVYLHVLAAMLLFVGHQLSKEYVLGELQARRQGALSDDLGAFERFLWALIPQLILSTLCAFLMKTRKVWLFSAPTLPLLARLGTPDASDLLAVSGFAATLSEVAVGLFLLFGLYRLTKAALSFKMEVVALSRLLALGISLWSQLAVPVLFSVFWSVLFAVHLCSNVGSGAAHQGVLFFLLTGSVCKHLRGLSMCLLLLVFPVFMAYKISQFFHMDFWLLILVAGCMLTSLQVTGTLFIYALFMAELFRGEPVENLDEVIYWVNAVSRALEFAVALCVVAYGAWESLLGEWSWMGASVIVIHSYCNVWLRAQSAWRSFLLRLEAVKKINSLPRATPRQLRRHDDVCAICFLEMKSAVVTSCEHLFHANCLSKWLHVQGTCPMCHQTIPPKSQDTDAAAPLEENVDPEEGPDDAPDQET